MSLKIAEKSIGVDDPVYFVADIAANHCGELSIAKELVHACAESGVDAVKMQNFSADTIVSDYGFRNLEGVQTHQSEWSKSVYESYGDASIPLAWTEEIKTLCDELGLAYLTTPYSLELVHAVAPYVSAFKVGSGDVNWHEEILEMASYNLPLLIATGASEMAEVEATMNAVMERSTDIVLMQCNTEYTASVGESVQERNARFQHVNLRVLETYAKRWPNVTLGLSDHTHGSMTVLGAVGLFDCSVVEKHFTFDNTKTGQDHSFSMTPDSWRQMVDSVQFLKQQIAKLESPNFNDRLSIVRGMVDDPKTLDLAIGDGVKRLEGNESSTVIVQRRALRLTRDLKAGASLAKKDVYPLRPCPIDALPPSEILRVVGAKLNRDLPKGAFIRETDLS